MKTIYGLAAAMLFACNVQLIAQSVTMDRVITVAEVSRIEQTLASDAMEGRRTFTQGIEKAADFIGQEMQQAGLQPFLKGTKDYFQSFVMTEGTVQNATVLVDGKPLNPSEVLCIATKPTIEFNETSGYRLVSIPAGSNFMQTIRPLLSSKDNVLILADTSFSPSLKSIKRFLGPRFPADNQIVIALSPITQPTTYSFSITQNIVQKPLKNVVGYLPGKTKPNEMIVFGCHYDHLGYGKPTSEGDSVYNGANDDASGVTAMLLLAKYYAAQANNQRTLVFVAFTGEEMGMFGSKYFSEKLIAEQITAMFNIEMIGTESKWGRQSAFITGYDKSNLGKLMEQNLQGTAFTFYPDPYPQQQLFYRSDNATLARKGVPAHTISTTKMDVEKYYHTADDEVSTLDMVNMTEIIKAIALSCRSVVEGIDTPTRVNAKQLER